MEEPILELRALGDFIASILKDGDEIASPGSPEASGARGSVETGSASALPTSSPYFNTILNAQPATQASTYGQANTESATNKLSEGSSAFADLLKAAGQVSDSNEKSTPPRHEPKRESPIDLEDYSSPSYSPPTSPYLSFDTLLDRDKPIPDIPSYLLSRPTPVYHPKPASPLPHPRVPAWKVDLSARKGHPIHTLHVGPHELSIISRCLRLVHKATRKGEECARVIGKRQQLAVEMQKAYEQWEEFCSDLEDNVKIEKMERGSEQEDEDPEKDDDDDNDAWFGTSGSAGHEDARDYGRLDPSDGNETWGYRKFDAPTSSSHGRRLDAIDEDEETETDTENPAAVQARRTAGFGARAPAPARAHSDSRSQHSMQSRMDVSSSPSPSPDGHDADNNNATATTNQPNATFLLDNEQRTRDDASSTRDDHDAHAQVPPPSPQVEIDREMTDLEDEVQGKDVLADLDDGMELDEESGGKEGGKKKDGKMGLKGSGGKMVGLYGEEI